MHKVLPRRQRHPLHSATSDSMLDVYRQTVQCCNLNSTTAQSTLQCWKPATGSLAKDFQHCRVLCVVLLITSIAEYCLVLLIRLQHCTVSGSVADTEFQHCKVRSRIADRIAALHSLRQCVLVLLPSAAQCCCTQEPMTPHGVGP